MQRKYIKVTEKDKSPFIALTSNESFYKNRGAKIEEPTQEEIEKCFPEEKKPVQKEDENALSAEKASHNETKSKLDAEILAHNETKQKLETTNGILQAKNEELDAVKSELDGLKKKPKKDAEA